MLHGGHPATHGPSASSHAADPTGTGISEATASFIAANASPFISTLDLIQGGAKVPDPRTTERTCATTLTARLTLPVTADLDSGKMLIIVDADPLSQLPIWVSRKLTQTTGVPLMTSTSDLFYYNELSESGNSSTQDRMDPQSWGQVYQKAGMADFFAATKTLGEMSAKHRIVGCAVRANIGVDTTLARGSIEAGQFQWSDTKNTLARLPIATEATATRQLGLWTKDWQGGNASTETVPRMNAAQQWANMNRQKAMATLINTCAYDAGRSAIRSGKTQDSGILDADQGACVRWTDMSNYNFAQTINRNLVGPSRAFYTNGHEDNPGLFQDDTVAGNSVYTEDIRSVNCNALRTRDAGATLNTFNTGYSRGPLCCFKKNAASIGAAYTTYEYFCADSDSALSITSGQLAEMLGSTAVTSTNYIGDASFDNLDTITYKSHFDKGLYIDITGVSTNQWVNIDVVWHVEYIPKSYALTKGTAPPIDMNFDQIEAMLLDPKHFPIVVKGNSFFSSLWHGLKNAVGYSEKVLRGTSHILSSSGIPLLSQAAGVIDKGLGIGEGLYATAKRARFI